MVRSGISSYRKARGHTLRFLLTLVAVDHDITLIAWRTSGARKLSFFQPFFHQTTQLASSSIICHRTSKPWSSLVVLLSRTNCCSLSITSSNQSYLIFTTVLHSLSSNSSCQMLLRTINLTAPLTSPRGVLWHTTYVLDFKFWIFLFKNR